MVLTVPIGLVSVMPQPWRSSTPCLSRNASIMARGTAAPPTSERCSLSSRLPAFSVYCRSASQTVGTPSAIVTSSPSMSA